MTQKRFTVRGIDIFFLTQGSGITISPVSPEGVKWIEDNVEVPEWSRTGGGFYGSAKQMRAILDAMEADGLIVQ